MAITHIGVGASTVTTVGDSVATAAYPGGYTAIANHLAIVKITGRPSNSVQPELPSGYSQQATALMEIGASDMRLTTIWKFLAASEAAPGIVCPTSGWPSGGMAVALSIYSGVDLTNPFDVSSVTSHTAAADQWTPPGLDTATNGAWVMSVVETADDNALALLAGSEQGFTARMSGGGYDTSVGADHALGVADVEVANAGTVTCPTWDQTTNGTDAWVGITMALRPAAEAGGDTPPDTYYYRSSRQGAHG